MLDRQTQNRRPVTVEDLLRLKRQERPQPEFWAGFEQELRQKQLAALVERRSWWHSGAAAFGRLRWMRLPVGATAILAVTLVSIHQYSLTDRYSDQPLGAVPRAKTALLAKPPVRPPISRLTDDFRPAAPSAVADSVHDAAPKSTEASFMTPAAPQAIPQELAELVQHVAGLDASAVSTEYSKPKTLGGSFAMQLGAPAGADLVLVDASQPAGFEDRSITALHARRIAEALPTAVAVTEQRRTRLLAVLGSDGVYSPEPAAPERATRSVVRHLAEDDWNRSMSRLQADADRLSIRF
jgi:hypothetical protein